MKKTELDIDEQKLNELIVVENVSTIKQNLQFVSDEVDKEIKFALSLNATEENKVEVKQARARLNNIKSVLEAKRKTVKELVMNPYLQFEEIYNEMIKNKFEIADSTLKSKIDEIENKQKEEKTQILKDFFNNYQEDYHLENIISFEDVGLNITLSASEKSLKDQIVGFFDKVSNDIKAIQNSEHKEEILIEYKQNGFDYAKAVVIISEKYKAIQQMQETLNLKEAIEKEENQVIQNVQTLVSAPVEVTEEIMTCNFTVTTTKDKLKLLKQFLEKEGIEYK